MRLDHLLSKEQASSLLFNFEGLVPHFNLYFENCIQESKVPEKVKDLLRYYN